jgi:hypothetical protein
MCKNRNQLCINGTAAGDQPHDRSTDLMKWLLGTALAKSLPIGDAMVKAHLGLATQAGVPVAVIHC